MFLVDRLEYGGAEQVVKHLYKHIDGELFEPCICCLAEIGSLGKEMLEGGFNVITLKSKPGRDLLLPIRLAGLMRKLKVRIVHAHTSTATRYAALAKFFINIPVFIQTYHGREIRGNKGGKLYRFLLSFLDARVYICNRLANDSDSSLGSVVIYNGIEISNGSPTFLGKRGVYGVDDGDFIILNIANIKREKGQDVLIKAFSRFRANNVRAKLFIAGNIADSDYYKDLCALVEQFSLKDKVFFLGLRRDIAKLLAACDVFVLSSVTEGMPMSILEAMAAKKPVIASDVGGIREVISHLESGYLVKRGDVNALAEAFIKLYSDSDLRFSLVEAAYKEVGLKFSAGRMAEEYSRLYLKIMKVKKRILLIGPFSPPVGGMFIQANLIYNSLRREKVALKKVDTYRRVASCFNFPVTRSLVRWLSYIKDLSSGAIRSEILFIYSSSWANFILVTIPAVFFSRLLLRKVIISYHGGNAGEFFRRYPFFTFALRLADRVVVPSAYLAAVFNKIGISCQILPNIIDSSAFSFKQRTNITPRIVTTRSHSKNYNLKCAIDVFSRIKNDFPEAYFTIAGCGSQTGYLKDYVKKHNIEGIEFKGCVNNKNLPEILNEHDIFLNTSLVDNMPLSILEAFASGLLVVSTPAGGIPFLVKDGFSGYLADDFGPVSVENKLRKALGSNGETKRIISNAASLVSSYTWDGIKNLFLKTVYS